MRSLVRSLNAKARVRALRLSLAVMSVLGALLAWAAPAFAEEVAGSSPFETAINPATIIEKIETKLGGAAVPIVGLVVVLLVFGIVLRWIKRHSKGAASGT